MCSERVETKSQKGSRANVYLSRSCKEKTGRRRGGGTFCPILIKVKVWGLPFIHININSILPKIEELCCGACLSNAAVIRISESKLYNSIFDSEIEFDSYNILRF